MNIFIQLSSKLDSRIFQVHFDIYLKILKEKSGGIMIIQRNLLDKVLEVTRGNEIVVWLGARQVGKTTLPKDLQSRLKGNTLFLDMEDIEVREMAEKTSEFIRYLEMERKNRKNFLFFLMKFNIFQNLPIF